MSNDEYQPIIMSGSKMTVLHLVNGKPVAAYEIPVIKVES
jgi:hypothetical protein